MLIDSGFFNYNILIVFFLGLGLLLISDLIGFFLFKTARKNTFFSVLIGLLVILSIYAIIKARFNSIGLIVLLWIVGYEFFIKREQEKIQFTIKETLNRHLTISFVWILIFALKSSCFWNASYDAPNLMFVDYQYYMKIAEGYNLTGNENAMGLKNQLLPFLDFSQPYRSGDLWIVSLGLDLTRLDTIYIWELFYSPILLTVCTLSIIVLFEKKYNILITICFSVLLLFAFAGEWYRNIINLLYKTSNTGSYDPIGIIAYTKLAFVFSIFFQFLEFYLQNKKQQALYLIILIPLLVQSAIGVFLFVAIVVLFEIIKEKKNIFKKVKEYAGLLITFLIILIGFFIFYKANQGSETSILGFSNLNIINNKNISSLIVAFYKKFVLLFLTYYWLSFILLAVLLFNSTIFHKRLKIEMSILIIMAYSVSILVYAQFVNVGDAYQFSTNFFGPLIIALIIFIVIKTPFNTLLGKFCNLFIIVISFLGINEIVAGNNVFHSTKRIEKYDKTFIKDMKVILENLNYPFGIIYYGEDFNKYPREDFPQEQTSFLKLYGRNFDAFNIQADSLKIRENFLLQKENLYIRKNALNVWIYNKNPKEQNKFTREDFFNEYPFSFCISKQEINSLPFFIKKDILKYIKDDKTGVFFYILDNSKKIKNAAPK